MKIQEASFPASFNQDADAQHVCYMESLAQVTGFLPFLKFANEPCSDSAGGCELFLRQSLVFSDPANGLSKLFHFGKSLHGIIPYGTILS